MPGFIDPHIHYPQMQVIGCFAPALLEWLNTYTFVEEQKFADRGHAERVATRFFDDADPPWHHDGGRLLLGARAFRRCLLRRGGARATWLMIGGKVMMDRNCPEPLRDTAQTGYDDTKAGIEKWHGKGRALYAVTPALRHDLEPRADSRWPRRWCASTRTVTCRRT